jgi:hypothetical protein
VVSVPKDNPKIPQWEMLLSGAAAAMNLMIGGQRAGLPHELDHQLVSRGPRKAVALGLAPHESVVGFVHIGRHEGELPDRPRPDPATLTSDYSGPWEG